MKDARSFTAFGGSCSCYTIWKYCSRSTTYKVYSGVGGLPQHVLLHTLAMYMLSKTSRWLENTLKDIAITTLPGV